MFPLEQRGEASGVLDHSFTQKLGPSELWVFSHRVVVPKPMMTTQIEGHEGVSNGH